MSFVIKDANYDEYIKYNGLKMVDTADAEDVKNGKSKYFIVMEDDKYYTAFSLYECNDNEVIVSSNSPEIGRVEETITVEKDNSTNIKIAFSSKFMMEAIKTHLQIKELL